MAIEYDPEAGIDYGIKYDAPAPMAAPPMGPQFGSGTSVGSSGGYDPETGDRFTQQFRYTPVDPQQEMMRQAFERGQQAFFPPPPKPQGPTPYWENPETYYPRQPKPPDPIEQAKASTAAAYKYIAMRGYQQDLKEGKSAAESFAKWGPMLVQDTSLAPAMKAFAPPATYKFNDTTRAYEPQGGVGRPYFQPASSARLPDVGLDENVKMIGNQRVYQNPRTGAITKLDAEDKVGALDLVDYRNASSQIAEANKTLMDQYASPAARASATNVINQAQAIIKGVRGEKPPVKPEEPVAAAQQQASAPETPVTITITSKAEFDKLPSGAIYLNKGKKYRKP